MAKYVVLVDDIKPEALQALAAAFQNSTAGWWHWFSHAWLLDDPEARGLVYWRNFCIAAAPGASILVVHSAAEWTGFLPQKAHDWLDRYWRT